MSQKTNTIRSQQLPAECIRGFALIAIIIVHIAEKLFAPFEIRDGLWVTPSIESIGSASQEWLRTISQWCGFIGDQFVGVFLVLSGFLAIYSIKNATQIDWQKTTRRRLIRVLVPWWWVHLLILAPMAFFGVRASLLDWQFWASFAGIRCTVDSMYYAIGAWWYIPLLLQFIVLTPLLFRLLNRIGPLKFALLSVALGFLSRYVGGRYFVEHVDLVGSIFIFRLPEFAAGMAIAQIWTPALKNKLVNFKSGILFLLAGIAVQYFWKWHIALVVLPLPLSLIWTGLLLNWSEGLRGLSSGGSRISIAATLNRIVEYLGRNSLWIYLIHHPIVGLLTPREPEVSDLPRAVVRICVGIVLTIVLAKAFEFSLTGCTNLVERLIARFGKRTLYRGLCVVVSLTLIALVSVETAVRQWAPQDATSQGWAEKRVLVADSKVDWKLKSDASMRLRWESYDYLVQSNRIGFPRTEELKVDSKNVKRIMVLGDAFSSAEGVDTLQGWPNLLQQKLNSDNTHTDEIYEVHNFAITGYGPNQHEKVLREYLPVCKPNLVVVELFINDLVDVEQTTKDFYDSIGFGQLSEEHPLCWLTGRHTAAFARRFASSTIYGAMGRHTPHAKFLAMLDMMEREPAEVWSNRQELFADRLRSISSLVQDAQCQIIALIVPAGSQVAPAGELTYLSKDFQFSDYPNLDVNQPQRMIGEILSQQGVPFIDLRTWFDGKPGLYQEANLHWTAAAHQLVAKELSDWLLARPALFGAHALSESSTQ